MSSESPPFTVIAQPPLPPGWTEHIAPGGQLYYYNARTQESTYLRPPPPFPVYPVPQAPPLAAKKEKPLTKTPIPGTHWLQVKTTADHTFYFNKESKESVWTVPPEIREAVEALERSERGQEQQAPIDAIQAETEMSKNEQVNLQEIQRVGVEVEKSVKRKVENVDLVISKRSKIDPEAEEASGPKSAGHESSDEEESEEEGWQKGAAAQLAAEEAGERERGDERQRMQVEAESQKAKDLIMPESVNLSLDEGKALFKTLLREKEINPLHPWDACLPLFVSDPRYVLLPSVSARREAFDEYCRDRLRELRQAAVRKDREALSPKEEFERLLREEVTSTRTRWTDFRRQWKKERRFWGWGCDDRERERRFKEYIKELGEKKLEAARKAEKDFFALLKESGVAKPDSLWKDVKRKINRDPRYDAVGSSSLREELFVAFLKAGASTSSSQLHPITANQFEGSSPEVLQADKERSAHERKERAIREREEKVKADFRRLETDIDRSRIGLNREEYEQLFRTMLTDAIRDPQMTWEIARQQLKNDPRFIGSPLPVNQQMHLFHSHITQLRSKHLGELYALFKSYAPSLATDFSELPLPVIITSSASMKLQLDSLSLEQQFDVWQRDRNIEARRQFMGMLVENSFVEFWGRLGKLGGEGVGGGVKADDLGEGEGEGGGGVVDMKALAKTVDVEEMERVLRNDRRYIVFDHVPNQREQWIREYLSQLPPPSLSVHINQQG